MKLLVIQEQHFVRMPNGEVWAEEQSDAKFWERYLEVFEEIVVCARFRHADTYNTAKLLRSDHENVSFVELPNTKGVGSLMKRMHKIIPIMRAAMKSCDRIIFRAPNPISMLAYPLARRSGKPYALELVNNPVTLYSSESLHKFYQPIIKALIVRQTASMCKNANGVSYVTERMLQEICPSRARLEGESNRYFEGSYSTIRMEKDRYSFEAWPDEMPRPVTLIHTGKMEDYRKGQDIFIHVVDILNKKGYPVRGIVVGDGPLRKEFEKIGEQLGVSDLLSFVGWKAGFEEVREELKKAQIMVFPSMGEGLPRSVIEAMAQGLLCVGSKVDGICELLDEDCLVPEFTADCFVEHIEPFLKDWRRVNRERKRQFECSKRYELSVLQERRKLFYQKLKDVR